MESGLVGIFKVCYSQTILKESAYRPDETRRDRAPTALCRQARGVSVKQSGSLPRPGAGRAEGPGTGSDERHAQVALGWL